MALLNKTQFVLCNQMHQHFASWFVCEVLRNASQLRGSQRHLTTMSFIFFRVLRKFTFFIHLSFILLVWKVHFQNILFNHDILVPWPCSGAWRWVGSGFSSSSEWDSFTNTICCTIHPFPHWFAGTPLLCTKFSRANGTALEIFLLFHWLICQFVCCYSPVFCLLVCTITWCLIFFWF